VVGGGALPPRQRAAAVLLGANATLLFGCGSWLLDGGIRGDNQVLDYAYEPIFFHHHSGFLSPSRILGSVGWLAVKAKASGTDNAARDA
jgi:hypothetical protein